MNEIFECFIIIKSECLRTVDEQNLQLKHLILYSRICNQNKFKAFKLEKKERYDVNFKVYYAL